MLAYQPVASIGVAMPQVHQQYALLAPGGDNATT
jgi:hypothetical protein